MQINPVSPQVAAPQAGRAAPRAAPTAPEPKPATVKDSANISQKAKDLAAQLSVKTQASAILPEKGKDPATQLSAKTMQGETKAPTRVK
jgi:hypothetical protein